MVKDLYEKYFSIKKKLLEEEYKKKDYPKLLKHIGRTEYIILDALYSIMTYESFEIDTFKTSDIIKFFKGKEFKEKGFKISSKRIIQALSTLQEDRVIRRQKGSERNNWQIDGKIFNALLEIRGVQEELEASLATKKELTSMQILTTINPDKFFSSGKFLEFAFELDKERLEITKFNEKAPLSAEFEFSSYSRYFNIVLKFESVKKDQIKEFSWLGKDFVRITVNASVTDYHTDNLAKLAYGKVISSNKQEFPSLIKFLEKSKNLDMEKMRLEFLAKTLDSFLLIVLDILGMLFAFDILIPAGKVKKGNIIDYISL